LAVGKDIKPIRSWDGVLAVISCPRFRMCWICYWRGHWFAWRSGEKNTSLLTGLASL